MPQGLFALCIVLTIFLTSMPGSVLADEDDTRFLLERTRRAAEQAISMPQGDLIAPEGALLYEGQVYEVRTTVEDLEPAIYIAINTGQWDRLPDFLARYRLLRGHRMALVNMADALLARYQGDHALALKQILAAQAADPEDMRIRLELARLRFENNQDTEAQQAFTGVLALDLPDQARLMAQQYQQALAARAGWHGSMAVGFGYNNNMNQANGNYQCFLEFDGFCAFERSMPQPIHSSVLNYEFSVQRRFHVRGNHNVLVRPVSYGQYFRRDDKASAATVNDYSRNTAILNVGYNWLSARDNVSLTPYLEHHYRNRHSDYLAKGIQLEWLHTLNGRWQLGTSLDAKRYSHTDSGLLLEGDYSQYQAGVSATYAAQSNTTLYGGLDVSRKKYAMAQASSKDWALRGGVYHAFAGDAGLYLNAMGVWRFASNDEYDGFLGERRRDRQQVYIVSLGANGWRVAGMSPELRVRYSANRSNVDWAYGFRQTELSVMLRRSF